MSATEQKQLNQSKEILRTYLTEHGKAVKAEVARYDGLHHGLRFKQDWPDLFQEVIERFKANIRQIRTEHISDFYAYIISPERNLLEIGDSPEQTGTELLWNMPDLQKDLQAGSVIAASGYVFSLPALGLRTATVERAYTVMSHTAPFINPYEGRLREIVSLLEDKGYIAIDVLEEYKLIDFNQNE